MNSLPRDSAINNFPEEINNIILTAKKLLRGREDAENRMRAKKLFKIPDASIEISTTE